VLRKILGTLLILICLGMAHIGCVRVRQDEEGTQIEPGEAEIYNE